MRLFPLQMYWLTSSFIADADYAGAGDSVKCVSTQLRRVADRLIERAQKKPRFPRPVDGLGSKMHA